MSYRKLEIWKNARVLNKIIYKLSSDFPKEENYGLKSQLRRSSVSVVSNIAEGSGYESNQQFLKYLFIGLGSLCEVETQCYLSYDLAYIDKLKLDNLIDSSDKLKRMILSFMKKLRSDNKLILSFLLSYNLISLFI